MVLYCMSRKAVGILEKVYGRLDGSGYTYNPENAPVPDRWIFQQDNATCYTSKLVKQRFKDENITVINLPAQFLIPTRKTLRNYRNQSRMPGTIFHMNDCLI